MFSYSQVFCSGRHSTHDDVVTVEPLYENGTLCSQRAVLIAESTQPIRLSSVILAREIGMLKAKYVTFPDRII